VARARRLRTVDEVEPVRRRGQARGFTLVEILFSIVLVGILSATIVVAVGNVMDQSISAACRSTADAARAATAVHSARTGRLPSSFSDLVSPTSQAPAALVVPSGTVTTPTEIRGDGWRLTMTVGPPPTFTCSTASTAAPGTLTTAVVPTTPTTVSGPTTVAPTTPVTTATTLPPTTLPPTTLPPTTLPPTTLPPTTVPLTVPPVANGVTVSAGLSGDLQWFGEQRLTITNAAPITELEVVVTVVRTPGVSVNSSWTDSWGGVTTATRESTPTSIVYRWVHVPGQQVVAGSWNFAAQWNGTGTTHPTAGDTWRVTTTSNGIASTQTGTF
jgi:prepilin-type N-terminal cleavage/methylation domain-containing protein